MVAREARCVLTCAPRGVHKQIMRAHVRCCAMPTLSPPLPHCSHRQAPPRGGHTAATRRSGVAVAAAPRQAGGGGPRGDQFLTPKKNTERACGPSARDRGGTDQDHAGKAARTPC